MSVTHANPVNGHHTYQENEPYLLLDFAVADFSSLRGTQQDRINGQEFGNRSGKEGQHPAEHRAASSICLLCVKLLEGTWQVKKESCIWAFPDIMAS